MPKYCGSKNPDTNDVCGSTYQCDNCKAQQLLGDKNLETHKQEKGFCKNCKFFDGRKCRKKAPSYDPSCTSGLGAAWPKVFDSDWCGDYQPIKKQQQSKCPNHIDGACCVLDEQNGRLMEKITKLEKEIAELKNEQ